MTVELTVPRLLPDFYRGFFFTERHRGSEIDEILTGHRGQRRNLQVSLKIGFSFSPRNQFFSSWRLLSNLRTSSDSRCFKFLTYRHRHFDEIFRQSHPPRSCDEAKISSRRSQVTRCNELIELAQYRACLAIANKIFCTGTNKVMQGENGGKADESEISRTVTCDSHRHPHSSRVAWGLDDMWGFGRCHAQKYFMMQIRASEQWCCRIFEHSSEVHDIYPKLENIPVQNILFPIAEQAHIYILV